jgi:hypothetical protein
MSDPIGYRRWAIPEGHLSGDEHDRACILNASPDDAHVAITVFFADREPAGPYGFVVPAQRTLHMRFDELDIPRDTDYASVIESDVPVVVQHTRSAMTTLAYAGD